MRDPVLDKALQEAPVPVPTGAERRGLAMVEAAYAERESHQRGGLESRRPALPGLAFSLAITTLLAALLLSPAGAAVREWVDDVVDTSAPRPEPGLAEIPGGGRLLVQSEEGPWVVQPDGSRRLLGDYREATWSPRGLYVAAAEGRTLSVVEPDGDPRWSITASAPVADPRWLPSPPYDRIAYRAGESLRVVAGDGTGDRLIARRAAPVAPAWSPAGGAGLAYVSSQGMLRIANSEDGADLPIGLAGTSVNEIEWGAGGSLILETSPGALRLQSVGASKIEARPKIGPRNELGLPPGTTVVDAALSPRRATVAAILERPAGTRSSVVLFGPRPGAPRRLLTVPGRLGEVAWSPDGRRLLVAWPDADQWLFLPIGRGKGRAIAGVSRAFAPGTQNAPFPRIDGWCCRR